MADAYDGNLSDYRTTIPHAFTPNAFVILSNGVKGRAWRALCAAGVFQ